MHPATPPSNDELRRLWILGFAGHRNLPDPQSIGESIRQSIREFRNQVDGELLGRASAAAGADLLFLEACRDAGLPYSVVLPFTEDRFREDFESEAEWSRAKILIDGAASVEIAPGHEGVPEAYHLASREILDVSDAMIFVWDGKPARGIGGTEETVADARERGLPHQIIDATSGVAGPFETNRPFPWSDSSFARLPGGRDVNALFEALDRQARHGAPKSRWLSAGSITLNQLATLISAVLVVCGILVTEAPAVRFVIISFAALLPWIGARAGIQKTWLTDRLHAELLRSLLASHAFAPPLRPFAADLFLTDTAFLRSAGWKLAAACRPWDDERNRYVAERLDGQIDYLESKGNLAARNLTRLQGAYKIATFCAITLGAMAIANGLSWKVSGWINSVLLTFLPSILPAVAAWSLSIIALFEYKRRAGLYLQMSERLRKKRTELVGAKCRVTAAKVISSCERLLLTELWEWSDTSGKRR